MVLTLISIDQFLKYFSIEYLKNIGSIEIMKNVYFTYSENKGVGFGLFENNQLIFITIAIIGCFIGFYLIFMGNISSVAKSSILFLISGTVGNMIDRIRLGFVVDYIGFKGKIDFIFNIADIFIVVAVIILFVRVLLFYGKYDYIKSKRI